MNGRRMKNDIILASVLLLAALALYLAFALTNKGEGAFVTVAADGKILAKYALSENRTEKIKTEYGENTLEIKDGYAKITEADCKNQICVGMKKISRNGEVITCLPHHLTVTAGADGSVDFVQ